MKGRYLGHLSSSDPLYSHIQRHIAPKLGLDFPDAVYRVFKFTCSQAVYLYEEMQGRVRIVAKFHDTQHSKKPLSTQKTGDDEVRAEDVCDRPKYPWLGLVVLVAVCFAVAGISFEQYCPSVRIWEADWSCTRL